MSLPKRVSFGVAGVWVGMNVLAHNGLFPTAFVCDHNVPLRRQSEVVYRLRQRQPRGRTAQRLTAARAVRGDGVVLRRSRAECPHQAVMAGVPVGLVPQQWLPARFNRVRRSRGKVGLLARHSGAVRMLQEGIQNEHPLFHPDVASCRVSRQLRQSCHSCLLPWPLVPLLTCETVDRNLFPLSILFTECALYAGCRII